MTDAGAFWDREILEQHYVGWLQEPTIRLYANQLIGGERPLWPLEWFGQWLGGRTFDRALSIGCGSGAFERDIVASGLCRSVDAFDASITSLHLARVAAADAGLADRIRYFAADFNQPVLRHRYDIVFFHQSAHHVAKLEKLYRAVLGALEPDGLVYMDEYVGPSRLTWNDELIAPHRALYETLPASIRRFDLLPYPILVDDPSEAIRSGEIEQQLRVGFNVVTTRPYGGTLLSLLYPALRQESVTSELVQDLIAEEQRWISQGMPSYYAVLVATPKRGGSRFAASCAYWLMPKLKRIGRELRDFLT